MRQMWLQNPQTKAVWNLLPDNPWNIENGCPFVSLKGMGFEQNIDQEQVDVDYFISEISSKNKSVTGVLYFHGTEHVKNFQAFVGDFRRQFKLFYSPDGEYKPYDPISPVFYKYVTISAVDKTELNQYGWYECAATFSTQNDVWKKDVSFFIHGSKDIGDALVYPYAYEYLYGGRSLYSIEFDNTGRETGCIVEIKNNGTGSLTEIEWFIENTYIDANGIEQTDVQRSKWYTQDNNLTLLPNYVLTVNSNPTTQEAKVTLTDGTSQSVVALQEPSWDYINFVTVMNGKNKIVFYVDSPEVDISFSYSEQKELI